MTQGWGNATSIEASYSGSNGGVHVPIKGGLKERNFRIGVVHGLFKYIELGVVTTVVAFAIGLFIAVIPMLFEATVIDLSFFSRSIE